MIERSSERAAGTGAVEETGEGVHAASVDARVWISVLSHGSLGVAVLTGAMTTQRTTHLVLGGTGKTGSRVADRLRRRGVPVRIGSRSGQPPFDWEIATRGRPRCDGVTAVYMAYYPDLAVAGSGGARWAFADLAVAHGVRRLVLLSGRGEDGGRAQRTGDPRRGRRVDDPPVQLVQPELQRELPARPAARRRPRPARRGTSRSLRRRGRHRRRRRRRTDRDGHAGELYELTGPRLLSFARRGRRDREGNGPGDPVHPGHFGRVFDGAGRAGGTVRRVGLLTYLFDGAGRAQRALTDGVERALGRAPRDFTDYVRAAAGRCLEGGTRGRHSRMPPWSMRVSEVSSNRHPGRRATVTMGLMAGLFSAFAYSVMPGLGQTDGRTFVDAMQRINVAILNGWFFIIFIGAMVFTALAGVLHLRGRRADRPALDRRCVRPLRGGAPHHRWHQRAAQQRARRRRSARPYHRP